MTGSDTTLWSLALVLGAVVIAVTAWLLHRFAQVVIRVGNAVHAIWNAGTGVARNTASAWTLTETIDQLDAIIQETAHHRDLLGSDGNRTDA